MSALLYLPIRRFNLSQGLLSFSNSRLQAIAASGWCSMPRRRIPYRPMPQWGTPKLPFGERKSVQVLPKKVDQESGCKNFGQGSEEICIEVLLMSGHSMPLTIRQDDEVLGIKRKACQELGFLQGPRFVKLVYNGQVLDAARAIRKCGIGKGASILLVQTCETPGT